MKCSWYRKGSLGGLECREKAWFSWRRGTDDGFSTLSVHFKRLLFWLWARTWVGPCHVWYTPNIAEEYGIPYQELIANNYGKPTKIMRMKYCIFNSTAVNWYLLLYKTCIILPIDYNFFLLFLYVAFFAFLTTCVFLSVKTTNINTGEIVIT